MQAFEPIMSIEEIETFLKKEFPQIDVDGPVFQYQSIEPGEAVMKFTPLERHLRPGGTVSGPSLFALCDVAAYVVVLGHIGPHSLAVTTNMNINFMHKPNPGPLTCRCSLMKLGRRLAVTNAMVYDEGDVLVCQASVTYALPSSMVK